MNGINLVEFDASVFSVESVQKAVYRLGDRISASIAIQAGQIRVEIKLKRSGDIFDNVLDELRQTVNDYSLREKIQKETLQMRNLILAAAFSRVVSQENTKPE